MSLGNVRAAGCKIYRSVLKSRRTDVDNAGLCARLLRVGHNNGGCVVRYTVHVPESNVAMGLGSPLSAVEAYHKVRKLRQLGFKTVSLRNVETGEDITDVDSLLRDSPEG
jgi:hypothetical protein